MSAVTNKDLSFTPRVIQGISKSSACFKKKKRQNHSSWCATDTCTKKYTLKCASQPEFRNSSFQFQHLLVKQQRPQNADGWGDLYESMKCNPVWMRHPCRAKQENKKSNRSKPPLNWLLQWRAAAGRPWIGGARQSLSKLHRYSQCTPNFTLKLMLWSSRCKEKIALFIMKYNKGKIQIYKKGFIRGIDGEQVQQQGCL